MPPVPDVVLRFYLVGWGYQVDIYKNGKCIANLCRDYGGSAESREVHTAALLEELEEALARLRERFK